MAEASIQTGRDPYTFVGQTLSADGFAYDVDDEFAEAVDTYVSFVSSLRALGYIVVLERRVNPQVHWAGLTPQQIELFGTADCIAYHPGSRSLLVGDLKFGRGVAVEAGGNTQLRYYGAGAAHEDVLRPLCREAGVAYNGVQTVDLVIIQPRAIHRDGPVRHDHTTMAELRTWARTVLYDGVAAALADNGVTLSAGSHCRFCPALVACEKPKEVALEVAIAAFANATPENVPMDLLPAEPAKGDPNVPEALALSDDELAALLDKITVMEAWVRAIQREAHARADAGRAITGWKLVNKRALRAWGADDDAEVMDAMARAGLNEDEYSKLKPFTPAQVERRVGAKVYAAAVAPHVVKRSSGTTLASEGDPRNRIAATRSAQEAFGLAALGVSNP
jgi:hypothetical protein